MSNLSKSIGSLAGMLNQAEQRAPVMLDLTMIDAAPQVRTLFDEDSLQELAEDIRERGVRSPIEVREKEDGRWLVIAGERRLRAARLAGKSEIPAYIEQLDDEAAEDAQLLENIQREDLTTADIAALIGRRYERLKERGTKTPLDDIAKTFKKSKSWVSKHLALATRLNPQVAELLTEGVTQDIEILLSLQKLADVGGWGKFFEQVKALKSGKATRATVREALEAAQIAADESKAKTKEQAKKEREKAKAKKAKQQTPQFDPEDAIFEASFAQGEADITEVVANWPDDGREAVAQRLSEQWEAGKAAATGGPAGAIPALMELYTDAQNHGRAELAEFRAFLSGLAGEQFDAVAILSATRDFNVQKAQ